MLESKFIMIYSEMHACIQQQFHSHLTVSLDPQVDPHTHCVFIILFCFIFSLEWSPRPDVTSWIWWIVLELVAWSNMLHGLLIFNCFHCK